MLSGGLPGGCHHYAKNARRANFHAATPAPGYILGRLMRYVPEKHSFEGVELINSGDTCDDEAT